MTASETEKRRKKEKKKRKKKRKKKEKKKREELNSFDNCMMRVDTTEAEPRLCTLLKPKCM